MSGLIQSIVRRRRASASTRLGPPSQNGRRNGGQMGDGHVDESPSPPAADEVDEDWAPGPSRQPDAVSSEAAEPSAARADAVPAPSPAFRERGQVRRRARYLRQVREIQMRDIGGFLLELHRFGRERPDLVAAKVAAAADTDRELRTLEHALHEGYLVRELREPGIGGACEACGALHGSADRFCASCGHPLRRTASS